MSHPITSHPCISVTETALKVYCAPLSPAMHTSSFIDQLCLGVWSFKHAQSVPGSGAAADAARCLHRKGARERMHRPSHVINVRDNLHLMLSRSANQNTHSKCKIHLEGLPRPEVDRASAVIHLAAIAHPGPTGTLPGAHLSHGLASSITTAHSTFRTDVLLRPSDCIWNQVCRGRGTCSTLSSVAQTCTNQHIRWVTGKKRND